MGKIGNLAALAGDYGRLLAALPRAASPSASPKLERVLVLGYAAVGDLIFLLPTLEALRAALPKARIVFVGDRDPGAVELMPATGLADEVWTYTHPELARGQVREEIARRIAAERFDAVLVNQATPLRAFARAILPIALRVGHLRRLDSGDPWADLRRAAATSEYERRWTLNRTLELFDRKRTHTVERHLELLDLMGIARPEAAKSRPELPIPPEAAAFAAKRLPPAPGQETIGVHLGSPHSQYDKIWPAEKWGEVCAWLAQTLSCRFVLIGGPAETAEVPRFRSVYGGEFVDLVGKAGLLESFAAIARCDLMLSSDTGLSKAAMALGVPTVSVWGPVSVVDVGAVWDKERHVEILLGVSCSPCVFMALGVQGPGTINFTNCGHHRCLAELSPRKVVEAVLMRQGRSRG